MSFHYFVVCDICKVQSDGWDGFPDGWLGMQTADDSVTGQPKHLCPACIKQCNIIRGWDKRPAPATPEGRGVALTETLRGDVQEGK